MRLIKVWDAIIKFPELFRSYKTVDYISVRTKQELIDIIKNEEVSIPQCINVKQRDMFHKNTGSYEGDYITVRTVRSKTYIKVNDSFTIYNKHGEKLFDAFIRDYKSPLGIIVGKNRHAVQLYFSYPWRHNEEKINKLEKEFEIILNSYIDYDILVNRITYYNKKNIIISRELMKELTHYDKIPANPDMLLETMSMCGSFDNWNNTMKAVRTFCISCKDYDISEENLEKLVNNMQTVLKINRHGVRLADKVYTHLTKYFQTF